jgi:hypothetical protein
MRAIEDYIHFVKTTCKGRDSSHGYEHMNAVRETALLIFDSLRLRGNLKHIRMYVQIVALMHDVADHKYDKDGTLKQKVHAFLEQEQESEMIWNCIDAISYSKEKKLGRRWFANELPGYWLIIRDVVSDADKLEALGNVGIERCLQYAREVNTNKSHETAVKHLLQHMLDKLLTMKEYIETKWALEKADLLLAEMVPKTIELSLSCLKAHEHEAHEHETHRAHRTHYYKWSWV